MLTVYKASAGSGKTFRLVIEYLKLILENPFNYQHILAVTFTNKATNEMKSRILEQLNLIADGKDSATIAELLKETDFSEQFIRDRARRVLKNILHDYNRFSINTIDSFTQKVIKSFNRELGISPNFTLELDTDIILEEAVQRLFSKIGENKNLLKWLRDYSRERIEENYSQRLDNDIKKLGTELFRERFQVFFPEDGDSVYTRESLEDFVKEVRALKIGFENTLKNKGQTAVAEMEKAGLEPADFSGGARSSAGAFFVKLANGEIPNFTATVRDRAEDDEKWVTQKKEGREKILAVVRQTLQPILVDIIRYFDENFPRYNTALAVSKQIRILGILIDLKDEIRDLLHEKGILPMSDSNLLLSKIIGDSDSPFVYEKIGNYYKHFMLDEFQDTSGLQWKNFKPLVLNSLAEGNNNLIVGDVKQSIYRWRNSDWNILARQLQQDFSPGQLREETLDANYRSDQNIIEFNNTIMEALLNEFESRLFGDIHDREEQIERFRTIYASHKQEPGKKNVTNAGYIRANFLPNEHFKEESTAVLIEQVKMLQDKGIKAEEIAILIRKNKEGIPIIEAFLDEAKKPENKDRYNLSVLSNESLFLHASRGVLFIVHTLEILIDPDNKIAKATLLHMWHNWLKPTLKQNGFLNNDCQREVQFNDNKEWHLKKDYDEVFEQELDSMLERVKKKVLLASLDEAVTQIASQVGLFTLSTELPFIQTLIDKAAELKTSLSNDLSNLLFWWNEKGYKTSVNINEEVSSIRLLTVHKAKGLEYKAVLIPYFNWEPEPASNQLPILWCQPLSEPFNKFPLLPIQSGNQMKESEFAPIYFEEKVNNYIDTLNLVYVAFTRAKSVLIVNSPDLKFTKTGKESESKSIDRLLLKAMQNQIVQQKFVGSYSDSEQVFEYGSIPEIRDEITESEVVRISSYQFNDFSERIKLRLSGEDFLVESEQQLSEKNIGTLVHEILSDIETVNDVENACRKALKEGKINETEFEAIKNQIESNLKLESVKHWFDGSYNVLNERDLLSNTMLLRPDRIMYSGDTAIVVDYKTGEKIPGKYNRQVERYAQTLKSTGFRSVSGFLWYLGSKEVEKVCEL